MNQHAQWHTHALNEKFCTSLDRHIHAFRFFLPFFPFFLGGGGGEGGLFPPQNGELPILVKPISLNTHQLFL